MSISIHDYDFFTYKGVIPSLECAKLVNYYRRRREIAVLSPRLRPEMYQRTIIRKDYDDGIYPKEWFTNGFEYGGRAFSPDRYIQLPDAIEATPADMSIYQNYSDYFARTRTDESVFYRILNYSQIRISPNGKTINEPLIYSHLKQHKSILLHDYNLTKIGNAFELIKDIQAMPGKDKYKIIVKFPLQAETSKELRDWTSLDWVQSLTNIQYNGLIDNGDLEYVAALPYRLQYNITAKCDSEDDFLMNRLPEIFKQILFLRSRKQHFSLIYDNNFFVTPELENLTRMIIAWSHLNFTETYSEQGQTFFMFCKDTNLIRHYYGVLKPRDITQDQLRASYLYVRKRNYELFKMFYEGEIAKLKGGELVYDRRGNSLENPIQQ